MLGILPIMLSLCLMLLLTYYAQNYAGIIGASLLCNEMFYIYFLFLNQLQLRVRIITDSLSVISKHDNRNDPAY